jgi:hypothetical protein
MLAIAIMACGSPAPTVANCTGDPVVDEQWPFDRLEQVVWENISGAQVVRFAFDPSSRHAVAVRSGPTRPPFVERAYGDPIVVEGTHFYELTFDGLTQRGGDRMRGNVDVIREIVEVQVDGDAPDQARWIIGFVRPSCLAITPHVEHALIEVSVSAARP